MSKFFDELKKYEPATHSKPNPDRYKYLLGIVALQEEAHKEIDDGIKIIAKEIKQLHRQERKQLEKIGLLKAAPKKPRNTGK